VATTILMARHGETDWNRERRFQGHADTPLNDSGREQAQELAERLADEDVAAIYASPLARALETAEIVGRRLGLAVQRVEDLREVDVGSWSGLTRTDIESRFPDGYRRWLDFGHGWDDGETYDELGTRVLSALASLARRHAGERVLVVTHGGPMRAAMAAASAVSYGDARRAAEPVGNCAVAVFRFEDERLRRVHSGR
jgi:2,3-bisphosphoglycerate-dependent phosphoglycerate mutase